jgi:hypothetical protein
MQSTNQNRTVVSNREENLYHDSYFYCTYWNEGKVGLEEFTEEMIGSTAYSGGSSRETVTATPELIERWYMQWLPLKAKYDRRFFIQKGSVVYAPNARKYKSAGLVLALMQDKYDSREQAAVVEFAEGTAVMRVHKLVKLQEFVPSYL